MKAIHLNGRIFLLDQIRDKKFSVTDPYENSTLNFIADWLSEKQEFNINTSGSTGIPKTIHLERDKMITSALMTGKALNLQSEDNALVCLNTEFVAGKMMLVRGLEIEMNLFIYPPTSNPLLSLKENVRIDFTAMVPYQLETILKETPENLSVINNMKALIIGGAPISLELEEKIHSLKVPTYHTFGMTETISHIALRRLNGNEKSDYYTALENLTIKQDERNCLVINSPFSNAPIITNDMVEIKDEKNFKWLGRIDHVINSGGIKIHPEIIEKKIAQLSKVLSDKRFFITGISDLTWGEVVTIIIEDKQWSNEQIISFKEELQAGLTRYEQPKHFFFKEKFIETSSGKINRLAIKQSVNL
jgi:O-succinylbenzoic acid--CoA ligase